MAVDYLKDYLGVDPNDYSAMERGIAGISPLAPGQSILPQAPVMPRASIMDEGDFADATAPLMDRVYQREAEGREKAEGLSNELQALRQEMAQTSEAEVEKRAALERQIQETMQRENDAKRESETLANRIEALQQQMAQTSEGEVEKRAELEKQLQNLAEERDVSRNFAEDLEGQIQGIMEQLGVSRSEAENLAGQLETTTQERDTSIQSAEGLATELQDVQANLQEITQLRDTAVQNYQDALAQQDVIKQQAAENEAIQLEELRNTLLAEREGIVTTLEQDFGVQRSELESLVGSLEGQVGDLEGKVGELESVRGNLQGEIDNLSSQMQGLEAEKQDALAQQDIIRAEAAQSQQDALAQQAEQFTGEKSGLEQQIADLQAQITQQGSTPDPDPTLPDPDPGIGVPDGGMELFDPRGKYDMDYREKAEKEVGDPVLDFEVDIDKINALTPDDINPYIPFDKLDMDIDLSNLDLGEYGDAIQYPGGSKDFDETGGQFSGINFDPTKITAAPIVQEPIRIPKGPILDGPIQGGPILGGSDFLPKPPRDLRPPMPPSIGRIEDTGGNKIRPPMPPSIGRPEAPILSGRDFLPKENPDLKPVIGGDMQYRGGSKDFDFTGGKGLTTLPIRPPAPITGGRDFLPKPPRDIRPPMPPSIGRIGEGNKIIPRMRNENPVPFIPKRNKKPMQPKSVRRKGPIGRGMRPMSRASGGSISQAIADLQNKLR